MQIIKYVCLKHLKHRWDSSLLLGPTLTLSQTELKKTPIFFQLQWNDSCSAGAAVNFHAQHLWKEDVWGAAAFVLKQKQTCWRCKVATPRSFHGALLRRRTHEHTLHHLTLNFSQTFRAEACSQQAEVHLQAPPTLTNKTLWPAGSFGSAAVT